MPTHSPFCDVETALEEIRAGRMIVVIDDEDRENEGDLTMAAEKITPEAINFMAKYGRGLVCLAMTEERLDYLRLGQMSAENTSNFGTAFTESIDAKDGVTTGISAYDRSQTIRVAIDPATRPNDLARPGHVFPLRARKGGVLVRAGQTEASVDLARLAGLVPAGVICEIMSDDGTMARVPELTEFCRQHDMKMLTVAELIRYRMAHERYVRRLAESVVPTAYGDFRMIAYESEITGDSHIAMVKGDVENAGEQPVLVRMHSHCLVGDVFGAKLVRMPRRHRCRHAAHRRRRPRRAHLPALDLEGLFGRAAGRPHDHPVPSRAATGDAAREPAPHPARDRHRRANSVGPEPQAHPPAHQPSPQSRRPGRLRHRNRGAGPSLCRRQSVGAVSRFVHHRDTENSIHHPSTSLRAGCGTEDTEECRSSLTTGN